MSDVRTEPTAVIETRLVHDVHRRATSLLAGAATLPSAPMLQLTELRDFLVGFLHHHHESEDEQLWPLITAIAPQVSEELAALSGEHDQLDAALEALAEAEIRDDIDRVAFSDAAGAVRDLVHRHLQHEEPLLLPALRTYISEEVWTEFSQQVIATSPTEGAYLLVGFFDRVGDPEDVELILRNLPEPAHELVPAMRQQAHATLDALPATA